MCLHNCSKICFNTSTKKNMIEDQPLFQIPSSKILRYIQSPPTSEQRLLFSKYRPNNKKRVKCVCGFQAYIVFSNYELILKWNRSLRFALAVCNLKDKIKNEL